MKFLLFLITVMVILYIEVFNSHAFGVMKKNTTFLEMFIYIVTNLQIGKSYFIDPKIFQENTLHGFKFIVISGKCP